MKPPCAVVPFVLTVLYSTFSRCHSIGLRPSQNLSQQLDDKEDGRRINSSSGSHNAHRELVAGAGKVRLLDSLRKPFRGKKQKLARHLLKQEIVRIADGSKMNISQALKLINQNHVLNLSKLLQEPKQTKTAQTPSPGPRLIMMRQGESDISLSGQDLSPSVDVSADTLEDDGAMIDGMSSSELNASMHLVQLAMMNETGMAIMDADAEFPDEIPVWQVKQAISDAVDQALHKAEEAAAANHTLATMDEVKRVVDSEVSSSVEALEASMKATRFKRKAWNATPGGFLNFFKSVEVLDWLMISVPIATFLALHYHTLQTPSTKSFHAAAVLVWIIAAGLYCYVVFQRFGPTGGVLWLNGYILELVFMIESVLVCHIILQAFRTPKWVNEKALFIVVLFRIVYQMFFFMGFAELVFSGRTLPYILGIWLLYVAFTSAMDDDSSFDIMDTRVVNLARAMFGDRLSLTKDDNGALFVNKENKMRLSLVGLMVFCLICVDFLLYVDVALTKIEELQGNAFLCFSSAIWASLCMPELIFVTRDMFRRFPGLKYGISAVLVYTGLQMLLNQIWWPPICMDLIIWVSLLVLSTVIPFAGWRPKVLASRSVDAGTQACYMEQDTARGSHDVGVQ